MAENDTKEAHKVLLEQAKVLDLTVDKRWSTETLAEKVLEAQANAAEREQADFAAAKKTPVLLRKNAFPIAGQKAWAGQVVEVPIAMAKKWLAEGVAERADPLPGE
jgi:hypothetical protein